MTRVIVLGQPINGRRIARLLNTGSAKFRADFVEPRDYARVLATSSRSDQAIVMRVGYRVGASTPRGRIFDAFWSLLLKALPKAVPCHYWLGSDVLETLAEARAGTIRWPALVAAREDLHLSVAPWLTSELESVGLHTITALLPAMGRGPIEIAPMPSEFSVLTYLPSARFDFYGGKTVLEAARRAPDTRFDIVGGPGDKPHPSSGNVIWHGWVHNMANRYAATSAVVRIPAHDGFGNTVIEGLLNARHVVYTHAIPFVHQVSPASPEALVAAVESLHTRHLQGRLGPNLEGRAYALDEFDEEKLRLRLTEALEARSSLNRRRQHG